MPSKSFPVSNEVLTVPEPIQPSNMNYELVAQAKKALAKKAAMKFKQF